MRPQQRPSKRDAVIAPIPFLFAQNVENVANIVTYGRILADSTGSNHEKRSQIASRGGQETREAQPLWRKNGKNTGVTGCCAILATAAIKEVLSAE